MIEHSSGRHKILSIRFFEATWLSLILKKKSSSGLPARLTHNAPHYAHRRSSVLKNANNHWAHRPVAPIRLDLGARLGRCGAPLSVIRWPRRLIKYFANGGGGQGVGGGGRGRGSVFLNGLQTLQTVCFYTLSRQCDCLAGCLEL